MALMMWVKNWIAEQEGQDLVEYALLLVLIALVVAAALSAGGTAIQGAWSKIVAALGGSFGS